jgi:multiple sugar transport system ATP-binding protein
VTLRSQGQIQLGEHRFVPEGASAEALNQWRGPAELMAGLRPEHLRLAPATNRNLSAEICHVEALGNEQLLTCRLQDGSHLVQVRCDPQRSLQPGETVHLAVEPQGWRFFDGHGDALPRPRGANTGETGGPSLPPLSADK